MKSDLFELIEAINDLICDTIDSFIEILFKAIELISYAIKFTVDIFFKGVLLIIDRERVSHIDATTDQETFSKELEVLSQVSKVKQDALDNDNWNDSHTSAINYLSNVLYSECGWNESSIHVYMREVVESVPGLEYNPEYDEEI